MSHLTYAEAGIVGLLQGVTELFPLSSLGHSVLIPALVGGSWKQDLNVSSAESPYLAYIVGLHVATAAAMITFFWRDWVRIIGAFFASLRHVIAPAPGTYRFQPQTTDQLLSWMIIVATIPVGIAGLALEHAFRVAFSKPIPTALFLFVNGLILLGGERLRRRSAGAEARQAAADEAFIAQRQTTGVAAAAAAAGPGQSNAAGVAVAGGVVPGDVGDPAGPRPVGNSGRHSSGQRAVKQQEANMAVLADERLTKQGFGGALLLGAIQILALLPGISRDGVVMVGGMFRGLTRADAARFSFLLSAPVILAAGAIKIPDLTGHLGNGIRGQILFGSILAGVGAYVALRFLVKYLSDSTKTLTPFGIYCIVAGLGSAIYLAA
jgi:undecaprenyl-diphosphatase